MKKCFYVISLALTLLLSNSLFSKDLKIGYFSAPPFVIVTKDKISPKGVVVEMWEEIAKEMGDTIYWKQMTIVRLVLELQEERLDASSLFVPTPDRKNYFILVKTDGTLFNLELQSEKTPLLESLNKLEI